MPHTVGAFGNKDSYSYLAARWGYGPDVKPLPTTQSVFGALRQGQVDIGVVPIENVTGGWVADVLSELVRLPESDPGLRIIREIELPIVLCVAAKGAKARVETAARVLSHPYPLLHASAWLDRHAPRAERVAVTSTSLAADLAAKDPSAIALCNLHAAKRNRLRILHAALPTQVQNRTRFLCLSRSVAPKAGGGVTSLCFSTFNKPGSLHKAIGVFAAQRLNMVRLASQAVGSLNTHRFFVELEAAADSPALARALKALRSRTEKAWNLGSYPVDRVPKSKAATLY